MRDDRKQLLRAAREGLPIVRFELRSAKESSLRSTALNHVWMTAADDDMETVKARSACIARAAEQGWLRLSYALPVTRQRDYALYARSTLYASFCDMVREGAGRPGFLFDTPFLKRGEARLTAAGRRILEEENGQE